MNPLDKILRDFPLLILDGSMATEFERHGCNLQDRLWSSKIVIEQPDLIEQVHTDYFLAGAISRQSLASQKEGIVNLKRLSLFFELPFMKEMLFGKLKPIVAASVRLPHWRENK